MKILQLKHLQPDKFQLFLVFKLYSFHFVTLTDKHMQSLQR